MRPVWHHTLHGSDPARLNALHAAIDRALMSPGNPECIHSAAYLLSVRLTVSPYSDSGDVVASGLFVICPLEQTGCAGTICSILVSRWYKRVRCREPNVAYGARPNDTKEGIAPKWVNNVIGDNRLWSYGDS